MVALGGLSPQTRGRVQETVLKAKLPFSETSQVPGAAGNTVRIFFRICKKTDRLLLSTGPTSQSGLEGRQPGFSAQRWGTLPRGRASLCFPGAWGPL